MTIATTSIGLLPIFWSTGHGLDVLQPMAIPSVGGFGALISMLVPCVFAALEECVLAAVEE